MRNAVCCSHQIIIVGRVLHLETSRNYSTLGNFCCVDRFELEKLLRVAWARRPDLRNNDVPRRHIPRVSDLGRINTIIYLTRTVFDEISRFTRVALVPAPTRVRAPKYRNARVGNHLFICLLLININVYARPAP